MISFHHDPVKQAKSRELSALLNRHIEQGGEIECPPTGPIKRARFVINPRKTPKPHIKKPTRQSGLKATRCVNNESNNVCAEQGN